MKNSTFSVVSFAFLSIAATSFIPFVAACGGSVDDPNVEVPATEPSADKTLPVEKPADIPTAREETNVQTFDPTKCPLAKFHAPVCNTFTGVCVCYMPAY